MTSPFVYFAGTRLSQAELTAACLDGHLIALGEGFVPADMIESIPLRAASLAGMLGDALTASHLSAAWVLGGIDDPPVRHSVQRAVSRRLHHIIDRRLIYHDPFVPPEDLLRMSGVAVTSRARTAADLARTPGDAQAVALRTWMRRDPAIADEALAWFSQRDRIPHRRRAEALIGALQEDVTR
jgi:hypothetical protein